MLRTPALLLARIFSGSADVESVKRECSVGTLHAMVILLILFLFELPVQIDRRRFQIDMTEQKVGSSSNRSYIPTGAFAQL